MAQTKTSGRTCFLLAILILISISGTGTASEFHVGAGESVQDAINIASPGDIILVDPGEFNGSIYVNKENLTIMSASENPDDTLIVGENDGSYVFEIVSSNVKLSGFSIMEGRCGVFLNGAGNCTISNNKISNQIVGVYLLESSNNLLRKNMVYTNMDCGIKLLSSPGNTICGNYFNNTDNVRDNKFNTWNDSTGNYWSDYNGTDENGDGIGDTAYAINPEAGSMDYMPLMEYTSSPPLLPRALFTSDLTEGFVPLSVRFNDFSENVTSRLWEFGDGNNSSNSSPLHTYFSEGEYVVSLTVNNENGSDSASVAIKVMNASEQSGEVLPEAEFIHNDTEGSVPLVIKFIDISKNADCVTWTFGDGKTSCCPEPAHTFCCPGNYTVSLTAENENGTSTKCITINVLSNETNKGVEDIGDRGAISSTEDTDSLVDSVTRYASDITDEFFDDEKTIDAEVTENSESESGNESESIGSARLVYEKKLESVKDSVSTASSNILMEAGLSLENKTLDVQKNIETFADNSFPGTGDSLPETEKRIVPWIPSFLGLAVVVFMVSLLKRGRRKRK